MKILVPVKRVVDPYVTIQIDQAKQCVKTDNVKMTMNPFDEIALEQAIRLKEQFPDTEIVVITVGNKAAQEILRHGLALGADSAIHVVTDDVLQPLSVAKILQKTVIDEAVDFVLMGKQAIDGDHNQTGQMLAALLDWPQITFASAVHCENNQLRVTREVDGGLETLSCAIPAVVTADLRLNEPRYATLPNIMKAKSKPLTATPLADLGLDLVEDVVQISISAPPVRQAGIKLESAAELVTHLVEKEQII